VSGQASPPAGALLLLFDIDGTLLQGAAHAHAQALRAALHAVHGVDTTSARTQLSPAGRTDGEIARALLLACGVSARRIDERTDDVRDACCQAYAELCPPDLSDKLVPGVAGLLDWLASQPTFRLSLVTGNFEPVARIKLKNAGIGHYFAPGQGAFGSDSEDRAVLPPLARRRAGQAGHPFPRSRTIVIGDTPRDIACARADELRCLAVVTGNYGASELTGADGVAADTAELQALIADAL
jgi:phosphoglycolate phosphatase-like HAD superfamily hydrolase